MMGKTFLNFKEAIEVTTNSSTGYHWLIFDLLPDTLEGYLGNWSQEYQLVTKRQNDMSRV